MVGIGHGKRLSDVARTEACLLGDNSRGDPILRQRITTYLTDLGFDIPADIDHFHYSAVFVSWCVREAGISRDVFAPVQSHSDYVRRGLMRKSGEAFRTHRLTNYAPQVGDIINFNRDGRRTTFDQASRGPYKSESGIVVAVDAGSRVGSMVVGNNKTGTVGLESFSLLDDGFVEQRSLDPFICVLQVDPALA